MLCIYKCIHLVLNYEFIDCSVSETHMTYGLNFV